jgi:spore coat polysaccharide biosynthesis protein SpsF
MRIVAIIQARMGSSRLPGKILQPLAGKTVLQHVIERVSASNMFDEIVVATTNRSIDNVVAEVVPPFGATVVRGDENDVLSRFGLAAHQSNAEAIMRITADCPLIDPDVLASMVGRFRNGDVDVVSNCVRRTFPRGLDAELFSRAALEMMLREATSAPHREHVTPFIYENPDRFRIASHEGPEDHSEYRLTLDTPEDFELLDRVFSAFADPDAIRLADVIALLQSNPDWKLINAHIEQKKI